MFFIKSCVEKIETRITGCSQQRNVKSFINLILHNLRAEVHHSKCPRAIFRPTLVRDERTKLRSVLRDLAQQNLANGFSEVFGDTKKRRVLVDSMVNLLSQNVTLVESTDRSHSQQFKLVGKTLFTTIAEINVHNASLNDTLDEAIKQAQETHSRRWCTLL